MREEVIIQLKDVSTVYEGEERLAIKNVSLAVKKNELLYVVGPNAAGKTTLLETVNGLSPISSVQSGFWFECEDSREKREV